jgi:PhnB protein
MSVAVNPYLFFKGNAKEVMEFYKNIFGGELTVKTYGELGVSTDQMQPDNIMHAELDGGHVKLMASDTANASPVAAKVTISLSGTVSVALRKIFDQLSEGVTVQYPLKKEAWGDEFGSLTDKYGVDWMVNISGQAV